MDIASKIAEHLVDSSEIRISILPFMFLISIVLFVACAVLQILLSKKRVSYLGYIGCGLEIILSIILVMLYNSDMQSYMREGQIIANSIIMFLLFNVSTILLIIISVLTSKKHKNKVREIEKINIIDLE